MKQLNLFDTNSVQASSLKEVDYWKLFVDGAARNNPGPAGAGLCILKDEKAFLKKGAYLGKKTNNQAEYLALLLGLFYIKKNMHADDFLLIVSDSQLLVRQLEGKYRVKEPHLKPLYDVAKGMLSEINYDIAHVLREENAAADEQANKAIDKKTKPPAEFLTLLGRYEIHI